MGPLLRLVRDDDILPCRNACGAIAFLMTGEDEGVESRIQVCTLTFVGLC